MNIREIEKLPRISLSLAGSGSTHFRELVKIRRPGLMVLFCLVLSLLGTFRSFGFDLDGDVGVRTLYPYVAGDWGAWYWFAKCGLSFNTYFFIINLLFAVCFFMLVFPRRRPFSKTVSFTLLLYVMFWFFFGQTRYGMAAVLLGLASLGGGLWLIVLGALAFLIHRAVIGGVLLLGLWLILRRRKYGLAMALVISVALSAFMLYEVNKILLLTDYANYENLEKLPAALTPLKYYYLIGVLLLWKCFNWKAPDQLLILVLIFLPFSYFIVFAGRSYEIFAVIFMTALLTTKIPIPVKCFLLALFASDVVMVLAQHYFA